MHDSTITPQVHSIASDYAALENQAVEAMKDQARQTTCNEIIPMLVQGISDGGNSRSIFLDARGMLDQVIDQLSMTPQEALQAALRLTGVQDGKNDEDAKNDSDDKVECKECACDHEFDHYNYTRGVR